MLFYPYRSRVIEENYIILLVKDARKSYLRMSTCGAGEHFKKMCLNKNSFDPFLISFLFNSLENQSENRGVLLNSQKTKEINFKDQRNFSSNTFFKVFIAVIFLS